MPTHRFPVIVEQDEDGLFVAECPTFQGCYSQGATFEEALANIREVIGICWHELEAEGRLTEVKLPETIVYTDIAVAVGGA
ncbi:MAG: type II toxin-antitoxin system HicB family antitoxin [Calditrichota bacterium]